MSYIFGSVDSQPLADRRSHPRQSVLLSCVELEDNGGIVLNVSENGLAMQVVKTLPDEPYTKLRFQLSLSNSWIKTRGRIAWLSGTKNKAGVEFLDLGEEGRTLLTKWISSAAAAELGSEQPAEERAALPAGQFATQAAGGISQQIGNRITDEIEDQSREQITKQLANEEQSKDQAANRNAEQHLNEPEEASPEVFLLPDFPAAAFAFAEGAGSNMAEPQPSASNEPIEILSDFTVNALNAPETVSVDAPSGEPDTVAVGALANENTTSKRGGFTMYSPEAAARWHIAEGGLASSSTQSHSRMGLFVGLAVVALAITFVAISLFRSASSGPADASAVKKNAPSGAATTETPGSGAASPTGESFVRGGSAGGATAAEHPSSAGGAPATVPRAAVPTGKALSAENSSGGAPTYSANHSRDRLQAGPPSQPAAKDSGFVLQVAAMSDQGNALSFADTLRRKNFTVFVVKPPADPFYRVLVGPYSDARSAATGAAELRKQGFSAIRKPNMPVQ